MKDLKEYILMFIMVILLCLTVMMATRARADEHGAYLKNTIGLTHMQNMTTNHDDYAGKAKLKRLTPVVGMGIGYDFGNSYRVEAIVDYYFLFSHKELGSMPSLDFDLTLDTKVTDFVVNVFKDIELSTNSKFFIGVGGGVSSIQDECHGQCQCKTNGQVHQMLPSAYGRHVNRFTYRLTTGASYKVKDNVILELSYNYLNLGKNKPKYIDGIPNIMPRRFIAHNGTLGVRCYL